MKKIVLTTLNGRYTHSSIGLRYLYANLHEYRDDAVILEFVINEDIQTIAEKILKYQPQIIGIGVYIWNATDVHNLIETVKKVSPGIKIVLGGPEASYMPFRVNFDKADYIIQGEGEISFYNLCKNILSGKEQTSRVIPPSIIDLDDIELPYKYYSDNDVANRYIYVEVSRGCPFNCEFCLSSIDKKVRNFSVDKIIEEFEHLWKRGVRNFKFIDRTFNLNIDTANRLLDFFLQKQEPYLAHFEVIPDHFPDTLKKRISKFPPASLQLEIGIQTLNKNIAKNIKRKLDIDKIKENLLFLETKTNAHLHLDLIIGLPGESLESFGRNLDYLCSLSSSEIQVGILKKLSGTTLSRHDEIYSMVYSDIPPYDLLQNDLISFNQMQKMKRFARFWDLVYNSGNFTRTFKILCENKSVYESFYDFSEWIYIQTESTWHISLDRLSRLLFEYLVNVVGNDENDTAQIMIEDILKVRGRKLPKFLRIYTKDSTSIIKEKIKGFNKRQTKHIL